MRSTTVEAARWIAVTLTLSLMAAWPGSVRSEDDPPTTAPSSTEEPEAEPGDVPAADAPISIEEIEPADTTQDAPDGVERIEITGTRLPDNYTGLGPITTLTQDDLALSGGATASDLLQEIPSLDFTGSLATDVNGGRGRNTIGLRGLGPSRALILVNNRRFVSSSNGASDAVDIGNLPPQLIAGIDILRDGVSTIYGADAVAGVINFRLRRDYEGFEVNLGGSGSEEGDTHTGEASVIWGRNFARGNLTLAANIVGFDPLKITDRNFSRSPIVQAVRDENGVAQFTRDIFSIPQGATVVSNFFDGSVAPGGIVGFDPANGQSFSPFVTEVNGRNINDTFYLLGEGYRTSGSALFRYEVTNDIEFFSEVQYTRRDSKQRFSPSFIGSGGTLKNPAGFTFPVFRPDGQFADLNSPFLPADFLAFFFDRSGLGPDAFPNPDDVDFGTGGVPLTLFRGLDEFGPRVFQNESRTFRSVVGLQGSIPAPIDDFQWEVFFNYGRSDNTESVENEANLTRALASVQPAVCAQTPGCVLGDFFGENGLLNTPDALSFIRFKSNDRLTFHLRQFGIQGSTSILKLPAGNLGLAIGAEYREEDGAVSVDPFLSAGDTAGLSRQGTRGRQLIREAFFEANIPLVEGLPGFQELGVNVSGRYTDYSSFGGRYLSRYAVSWAPVESLRLRGVYSTSFRSPSISDLFLGDADTFVGVDDRCDGFPDLPEPLLSNCAAQLPDGAFDADNPFNGNLGIASRQVRANIGGNEDLQEETADTVTAGIVYNPGWMPGAVISADYYEINIKNPVQGQSAQFRVDNCLVRGITSECDAVRRDGQGLLSFVDIPVTNFGEFRTNGLDFGARYAKRFPWVGDVLFDFEGVYIFDFEIETTGGRGKSNGIIGGAAGGTPNMKGRFTTVMQPTEKLSLSMSAQYIGETEILERKILDLPFDNVPETVYLDVGMGYQLTDSLSLFLSVQNATDKRPPLVIGNNVSNTNRLYDVVGRRYSLVVRAEF